MSYVKMNLKDIKGSNNMAITTNDVKNIGNDVKTITKEEIDTKIVNAYKNVRKAYGTEEQSTKYKILYDLCEFYSTAVRLHVKDIDRHILNIDCRKNVKSAWKSMKLDGTGEKQSEKRRKVVYESIEGRIYGKCTMKRILDVIDAHAEKTFEKITKTNFSHVMNMILEDKGRKNAEGVVIGHYVTIDNDGIVKQCKKSEKYTGTRKMSDFNWK